MEYAVNEFIPEMWDLQYLGIRKMIGAMTREAVDHTQLKEHRQRGVKLVYGIIPAILTPYQAVKKAGGDKVFVSFPDMCLMNFLQPLFHKGAPLFELAEQSGLTYGCRHCALNKLRIGLRLKDVVPAPDIQWSFGLVCDEATKVDEYINCIYDDKWFAVITRLPHDTCMGEVDDEMPERVAYLANAFRDAYEEVQRVTGVKVREEHIAGGARRLSALSGQDRRTHPTERRGRPAAVAGLGAGELLPPVLHAVQHRHRVHGGRPRHHDRGAQGGGGGRPRHLSRRERPRSAPTSCPTPSPGWTRSSWTTASPPRPASP